MKSLNSSIHISMPKDDLILFLVCASFFGTFINHVLDFFVVVKYLFLVF